MAEQFPVTFVLPSAAEWNSNTTRLFELLMGKAEDGTTYLIIHVTKSTDPIEYVHAVADSALHCATDLICEGRDILFGRLGLADTQRTEDFRKFVADFAI